MLSNIVFIIILILLIIILGLLYFFSTDIRKNKNKINILESDLNAMRERMISMSEKLNNIENSSSRKNNGMSGNFADILNQLGNMNNNMFENVDMMNEVDMDDEESTEEDEEESTEEEEEEESTEEEEEDEEEEDEESTEENELESDEYDKESNQNDDIDENIKESEEVDNVSNDTSDDNGINNALNELITEQIVSSINEDKPLIIEDIVNNDVEEEPLGKPSKKELSKFDIGTIKLGSDNKTKYIVQLNKGGRKYWKKMT